MVENNKSSFPPPNYIPVESKLDGFEVFAPAPVEEVPTKDVLSFVCPRCGATTAYNAADGGVTCAHCGYHEVLEARRVGKRAPEKEFTVETLAMAEQGWGDTRIDLVCQNCGAVSNIPPGELTHTCAFCGSNKVIQRAAIQSVLRPWHLIPFKITPEAGGKIARQWLGNSWMTPAGLQRLADQALFSPIYLPFWTFDARLRGAWRAEVGHAVTRRYYQDGEWKTRTEIEWRWESGRIDLLVDDLLEFGSTRLSNNLVEKIGDYDLRALVNYEPRYLAGQQAHAYDIPLETAWESARQTMRERARQEGVAQASTSRVRNFSMALDFGEESWRYILLPVYLATYPYQQKSYQMALNGQTGTIAGQRPVDWKKVWLVIAGILTPGILVGLVGLLTVLLGGIGVAIAGVGAVLLLIGVVVAIVILISAMKLDDL